jgi:hypothetical protein
MTPTEHIEHLRIDYLKEIDLFFSENNINMIVFEPVENDLEIEPSELTSDGTLTLIDELGNDSEMNIKEQSIEFVAFILTLIHNRNYDVI